MTHTLGKTIVRMAPLVASILIVIEIILTNQLVGSSREVRHMDMAIDELRRENQVLEQQVASASSLVTIGVKSAELGFVPAEKSQYLTIAPNELPVAINSPQ